MKIICEAGLNWTNFNEAVEYAEKAKEIGADIVKYQWVKEDATYKKHIIGSLNQFEDALLPQMNKGEWKALKGYCDKIGIEFMCTPSDEKILESLINIGIEKIKIGSDHAKNLEIWNFFTYMGVYKKYSYKLHLISNGYYEDDYTNMYCVSLYPCDKKFIDFDKMSNKKYIGFSDHTLEYNKEWCDKIKACKNIEYVEKHFKLTENCIDANVSLNYEQMKEFIKNLK